MIRLTRLNGSDIWLNPLQIELVERTPDSIVRLTNGNKYVVRESPEEVTGLMIAFLARIGLVGSLHLKGEAQ